MPLRSVLKEGQRLKQRRHPSQISKMRRVSLSSCAGSTGWIRESPLMLSPAMKHEGWAECPIQSTLRLPSTRRSAFQTIEPFLETVRMRALGLGQGFEPFRQLGEALFTRRLRHAGIHLRVFVCFALDGGLQIGIRIADRHPGGGVSDFFE